MRISEIIGETVSGSIAGVATALGAGDPKASIYYNNRSKSPKSSNKKKQKKPVMIKRASNGEK